MIGWGYFVPVQFVNRCEYNFYCKNVRPNEPATQNNGLENRCEMYATANCARRIPSRICDPDALSLQWKILWMNAYDLFRSDYYPMTSYACGTLSICVGDGIHSCFLLYLWLCAKYARNWRNPLATLWLCWSF